ncbi:MAG: choice-of-anchor I family protein [Desulfobacterales bacterium]|nr:choice-of-anchor I family protein [Desulfobacterales bacterium]
MKKWIAVVGCLLAAGCTTMGKTGVGEPVSLVLEPLGTYETGVYDESAAEIVSYHAATRQLVFTSANDSGVTFLDISDPAQPRMRKRVRFHGSVNSVAVHGDTLAVAVAAVKRQDPGAVIFLDPSGRVRGSVDVGALPDMVCFTPDGRYVLTANEGEPSGDYAEDPEGSVTIISMAKGAEAVSNEDATTLTFKGVSLSGGVRITGPHGTTIAMDLEPEYIAVSPDSTYAYVSLQENNAMARIHIPKGEVEVVKGLGVKDHNQKGMGFDASKKDNGIRIRPWPVYGMYMPDAIAAYEVDGQLFLVSANEGDGREYTGYTDEIKMKKLVLDPETFPHGELLARESNLGGLVVSARDGDMDGDGDMDALYSFGGRSFTIWNREMERVYDSGNAMERHIAQAFPDHFNASNTKNTFDNRSPKKGPEPEGVTLGVMDGRTYAFILIERMGGIMVYDITDPFHPEFKTYENPRRFGVKPGKGSGDLGPEGAVFIPAKHSPSGKDLLAVANEVSGSVTLYEVQRSSVR